MKQEVLSAITPIHAVGPYLLKRDDLFCINGATGGKARATAALAQGAAGLVGVGARSSPQIARVALIAQALGLPCRVHTAAGAETAAMSAARAAGAELAAHRPGYMSVLRSRAAADAAERGWRLIPYGAISQEAVSLTAEQAQGIRPSQTIVVSLGSGTTAAGILRGTAANLIVGVQVGADPRPVLDEYAPGWNERLTIVRSELAYEQPAPAWMLGPVNLNRTYEAKCLPFLEPGDLLWVTGGPTT